MTAQSSAEWIEAAEACEAWVLDQRINHNRDWWLDGKERIIANGD